MGTTLGQDGGRPEGAAAQNGKPGSRYYTHLIAVSQPASISPKSAGEWLGANERSYIPLEIPGHGKYRQLDTSNIP